MPDVTSALEDAHRREWAYVLAATVRVTRDIDLAEECVQEAFVSALTAWDEYGVPDKPGAWLTTAARRKALDELRRQQTLRGKLPLLIEPVDAESGPGEEDEPVVPDDRLRLVFTCCHPALAREAQVALTLRLVAGLTTAEIARVFLVPEATMAARITRAKKKIAAARIPYREPEAAELPDRLDAVLTVLHLLYTSGHVAPTGAELMRRDLADRAIDLTRMLAALMPDEPEVAGLLALLLLTDARRGARADTDGRLVLLEDQDRMRWDRAQLDEGQRLTGSAFRSGRVGRFALQASIAAVHAAAPSYADTDWDALVGRYDDLLRVWPTSVVRLNRAVAVAMRDGPEVALAEVVVLAPELDGYLYLHATQADLLRRLGRTEEARAAYKRARALATNTAERDFLDGRIAAVSA
ncbi:MAG: polymerase sigma-70 factor, subfamily [Frankiales bacterium]|nr:polymerase sigma-70 factor, subfamily [Frankiales bacterium]